MLLAILLLNACGSIPSLQKVESKIPCLGAIGNEKSTLFKKEFQKVGEPNVNQPIAVSVKSIAFTKKTYNQYLNYTGQLGKKTKVSYIDSISPKPRFYKLKITDFVGLKSQLNSDINKALKEYLLNDKNQKVLVEISFVAQIPEAQKIDESEHLFVVEDDGLLTLEGHSAYGNSRIKMAALQVFDFETASFCWKNSVYGKPEIAAIALDGKPCPGSTEENPEKLNDTRAYLKF